MHVCLSAPPCLNYYMYMYMYVDWWKICTRMFQVSPDFWGVVLCCFVFRDLIMNNSLTMCAIESENIHASLGLDECKHRQEGSELHNSVTFQHTTHVYCTSIWPLNNLGRWCLAVGTMYVYIIFTHTCTCVHVHVLWQRCVLFDYGSN